jgi:urease accessory protein
MMRVQARVGARASLAWEAQPLVAAAGCNHTVDVRIDLDATASLAWREVLVLGREGERPGACRQRLRVDRAGEAILRHDLVVGATHDVYPALGDARVVGTLVAVDDPRRSDRSARTFRGPGVEVAVFPLERSGVLVIVLGTDARAVEAEMGVLGTARYP